MYNARRDNLEKFWGDQFGHHHAILVVESFFENVRAHRVEQRELAAGETERNVVLRFTPEPAQTMLIACLWSAWPSPASPELLSFAAITDEPPAAIAVAGHDRCIINVRPEHVEAWLTPAGRSAAELQAILSEPAVSLFQHTAQMAA